MSTLHWYALSTAHPKKECARNDEKLTANNKLNNYRRTEEIWYTWAPLTVTLNHIKYCLQHSFGRILWTQSRQSNWSYTSQPTDQGFHTFLSCDLMINSIPLPAMTCVSEQPVWQGFFWFGSVCRKLITWNECSVWFQLFFWNSSISGMVSQTKAVFHKWEWAVCS